VDAVQAEIGENNKRFNRKEKDYKYEIRNNKDLVKITEPVIVETIEKNQLKPK
jgi:hypothetical protein